MSQFKSIANTPQQVVIDDNDPRVLYSGPGWFVDNGSQTIGGSSGLLYKRTSHMTNRNGNISFSFKGTSVDLFGSLTVEHNLNDTQLSWRCLVDGKNQFIGALSSEPATVRNNWPLCTANGFGDGTHTLTVNVKTDTRAFRVDRLVYTASPEAFFDEAVLLVDQNNPAIKFARGWDTYKPDVEIKSLVQGKYTTTKGSWVNFDFVGKSVTWVGFLPEDMPDLPALASFSIDGGSFQPFTLNGLPSNVTTTVYHQEFFTTPELEPGPHSLVVAYNGSDHSSISRPATPLTLEYLYVTSTSTNNSSAPSASTAPSPNISPIPKGHPNLLPALIGGIVGGLVLLTIATFLYLRRRRQVTAGSVMSSQATPFTFFQPFTLISHDTLSIHKPVLHSLSPQRLLLPRSEPGIGGKNNSSRIQPYPHMIESSEGAPQPGLHQSQAMQPEAVVRHQDSGHRFNLDQEINTMEIPPEYTAS